LGFIQQIPSPEVKYLLGHSESKVLFAEDQEQVDKVLEVIEHLPNLSKIVYFESRGITKYDNEKLISWNEFIELGKEEYEKDPDFVD
jgi:long-chain acyl-CoA synthetase